MTSPLPQPSAPSRWQAAFARHRWRAAAGTTAAAAVLAGGVLAIALHSGGQPGRGCGLVSCAARLPPAVRASSTLPAATPAPAAPTTAAPSPSATPASRPPMAAAAPAQAAASSGEVPGGWTPGTFPQAAHFPARLPGGFAEHGFLRRMVTDGFGGHFPAEHFGGGFGGFGGGFDRR